MTTRTGADEVRSPADQLAALGSALTRGPSVEDDPRWHLAAAEEAMDEGRWDTARAALERARENAIPGSPDLDEAAFTALRLALATVDLRAATTEVTALAQRMDAADSTWARRVRRLVDGAPRVFPPSMRVGLLDLLPVDSSIGTAGNDLGVQTEVHYDTPPNVGREDMPAGSLPQLPDEEMWMGDEPAAALVGDPPPPPAGAAKLPPVPSESPFSAPARSSAAGDAAVPARGAAEAKHVPLPHRLVAGPEIADLTDADALRERLVESMLASVTDDEAHLLFETATTFLNNGQHETAELMFSAAMQAPELRVAACEGVMQSMVSGGRFAEAIATGARAMRLLAGAGDGLLGITYWQGVAAQLRGDAAMARTCFARVAGSAHALHFPDVAARRADVA